MAFHPKYLRANQKQLARTPGLSATPISETWCRMPVCILPHLNLEYAFAKSSIRLFKDEWIGQFFRQIFIVILAYHK